MSHAERPGAASHEGSTAGIEQLTEVMGEAVRTLDKHEIDYLLIGGQASALLGRPRCSSDIDLLVTPEDAPIALDAYDLELSGGLLVRAARELATGTWRIEAVYD